jgi:uncharacterized FlaG/YvyC family protein
MDVSGVTRPLPVAAPQPLAANVGAQPTAVKTILPTPATVTATDNSQAARFDGKRNNPNAALDEAVRQAIERHLVIDPETKSLVLKVTEEPSGKVVRQIPDEVILKLRAYVRELIAKRAPESDTPRVEKIA